MDDSHEIVALPPEDLLSYYKTRIGTARFTRIFSRRITGDFESEREELLKRLDGLSVDRKELHRLEWENKQRSGEIWELQKVYSLPADRFERFVCRL